MKDVAFVNKTDSVLKFKIGKKHFEVSPGDFVEIPEKYVYAVEAMGVKLSRVEDNEKDEVKPEDIKPMPATEMPEVSPKGKKGKHSSANFVDADKE